MADTILFTERSMDGRLGAVVDATDGVVYLYLQELTEGKTFGMKACWVRNLKAAPKTVALDGRGRPPALPAECCGHPQGGAPIDPKSLSVVWFEEGDGVALFERDQLLAIIPGWSGIQGFAGYARDCIADSPLCWPLPEGEDMLERIERAREYWASWHQPPGKMFWPGYQDSLLKAYQSLGTQTNYYSIDSGGWPPMGVVQLSTGDGVTVLATVGMSVRPMPGVEMALEDPVGHRRVELAIALRGHDTEALARQLSGLARYPWGLMTWFGQGHTVPFTGLAGKPAVLLCKAGPDIAMPGFRGDPINLLWLVGITEAQRNQAMGQGSDSLAEGLDWVN
ncbi:MAG: suppressor of fused domain protein [Vulcanimicrobiota bacterium]